jgi:alkylhydroperoxidase/carboxymuconolactone decarboxylase family protein YurZ
MAHFGAAQVPAIFQYVAPQQGYLAALWGQYCAVLQAAEIDRPTKDLRGFAVAVSKSHPYMIALQQAQLRQLGVGTEEEREALVVSSFFEGFDAFAHALHVDSELRPRRLLA